MLDTLLIQSWRHPYALDVIRLMCGFRYTRNTEIARELTGNPSTSRLSLIALPVPFEGRSFGSLFTYMILQHGIIPIGLRRKDLGLNRPHGAFIYTNPLEFVILRHSDSVYVLY
jgi:hypothetical protein